MLNTALRKLRRATGPVQGHQFGSLVHDFCRADAALPIERTVVPGLQWGTRVFRWAPCPTTFEASAARDVDIAPSDDHSMREVVADGVSRATFSRGVFRAPLR